jgi:hypothetical protein
LTLIGASMSLTGGRTNDRCAQLYWEDLLRTAMIIALLLLSASAAFAEEERTCDKDTLLACLVDLPCNTYHRNPQGEIVPVGIKIKLPNTARPIQPSRV